MNKGEIKIMDTFKPYINAAQAFVDEHIGGRTTMTAKEITEGFFTAKINCAAPPITKAEFEKGFRLALREGLITGLAQAQRKGYKRAGVVLPKSVVIKPSDWETICRRLHLKVSDGLPEMLEMLEAIEPLLSASRFLEIRMQQRGLSFLDQ